MPPFKPPLKSIVPKRPRYSKEQVRSRVMDVLRQIDPLQKEVTQRKLFVEQYMEGVPARDLLKHMNIAPLLKRELESLYEPVPKVDYGDHKKKTTFVPDDIERVFAKMRSKEVYKSHEAFLKESSVVILVHDKANTLTNKMYTNTVVRRIQQLEGAGAVKTRNMDTGTLKQLVQGNENLVHELSLLQREKSPILKAVCIPSHAIGLSSKILSIMNAQRQVFPLICVYLNLKSANLRYELKGVIHHDSPKEISYDSLVKMAARTREQTTTSELVTTVGQMGLLEVGVSDKAITFTNRT